MPHLPLFLLQGNPCRSIHHLSFSVEQLTPHVGEEWEKPHNMSSRAQDKDRNDNKEREERLANLSGAMAVARLTHQVKELELQKTQQDKLAKPSFTAINCIM
jgi:hypothetical protein